jgi:hypothetical protein
MIEMGMTRPRESLQLEPKIVAIGALDSLG